MARPQGTGSYSDDDEVGAEIQAALKEGRYSSKTAAITAHLDRLEGPTKDAKIRRMLRWLEADDESTSGKTWMDLGERLSGLSARQKADELAAIAQNRERFLSELQAVEADLDRRGVTLSPDERLALVYSLVGTPEEESATETDINRQERQGPTETDG